MVHLNIIEARLSQLGIRSGRLSRPELLELQHLLMDDEQIVSLANGRYFAGFATLVATNVRLLIIDKRPFFMTYEDIRYDMISELDYTARLMDATVHIFTINKQHRFTSMRHKDHLKTLTNYVQQRVMEIRQHQQQPAFAQAAQDEQPEPPPQPAPGPAQDPAPPPPPPPPVSQVKYYRVMASKFSGRVLGPVAVKAAHRYHVPNPVTGASFMVRHSSSWFKSHTPQVDVPHQIFTKPEF